MSAEKVVAIARQQVGYLEKASNAYLDEKTANAGYNNYTKFGRWYGLNPAEWCDMFVSWCGAQAGEGAAVGKFAYCPSHVNWFKSQGRWFNKSARTPQPGDIIFFGDADHVGLVEYVSGNYVHTIEGNTRSGTTLVANGGGVYQKYYPLDSSYIMGYGRPGYSSAPSEKKELKIYPSWMTYQNGSTAEPVYKDTDRTQVTGSLNPWETCYCTGRYGDSYAIIYKVDGSEDNYAVGYVGYNGGINE